MAGNFNVTNEKCLEKQYPLHKACRDGDQEILSSLLLLNQHDLYEEDGFYGWTPAHWAGYFGKLACLRKVMCEIDLTFPCNYSTKGSGLTPVHTAALGGQPHCLLWLIQAGGNLGAKDYLGDTPLHKAARAGSMECISLLVAQNAALDIRNYNGQTASEVAANSSHNHCAEYLQKALELHQKGHLDSAQFNIQYTNNQHTMHNGHRDNIDSMDCDMDMDTNNSNVHCDMTNGDNGTCIEMNGIPIDGRGDSVFRAFAGMKRSFDDDGEEHIKRRCFREDYNPAYHINPKTSSQTAESLPTESLSNSSLEHSLAVHEAQGYDSLLAASMVYHN